MNSARLFFYVFLVEKSGAFSHAATAGFSGPAVVVGCHGHVTMRPAACASLAYSVMGLSVVNWRPRSLGRLKWPRRCSISESETSPNSGKPNRRSQRPKAVLRLVGSGSIKSYVALPSGVRSRLPHGGGPLRGHLLKFCG